MASPQGPRDPLAGERAALDAARAALSRLERLQTVTAALAGIRTPGDVAEVALGPGLALLGASSGMVLLPDAAGRLEPLRAVGAADPADLAAAAAEAWTRRAPALVATLSPRPPEAVLALPLALGDRVLGVLAAGVERAAAPGEEARAVAAALAGQCAQALERARLFAEAQRAVEAREDFLHVASHELRGPLGTLLLGVQLLARDARAALGPALDARLRTIERQADRLARLSDVLLDVSRIGAGPLELQREEADLAGLAREAVGRLAEEAAEARCELTLDAAAPVRGSFDVHRIEQVIANLLSNALKYGRGTPVAVAVRREGDRALLVVADGGIGIPFEHQARVFGRFERAVSARNFPGLGLGLWIVRRVVDAHGGTVRLTSAPGQGTSFTVELPLATG